MQTKEITSYQNYSNKFLERCAKKKNFMWVQQKIYNEARKLHEFKVEIVGIIKSNKSM